MQRYSVARHPGRFDSIDHCADLAGGRYTDGVAEADRGATELDEPSRNACGLLRINLPLPRVAEAHRDIAADAEPIGCGSRDHRCGHLEGAVQGRSQILLGEPLSG